MGPQHRRPAVIGTQLTVRRSSCVVGCPQIDDFAVDRVSGGGDGLASISGFSGQEKQDLKEAAVRTISDPTRNPTTGADLGAGPGAGRTKDVPADA